jgi:hypothetical protein
MDYASLMKRALERERVALLGSSAQLKLYKGTNGRTLVATITTSFALKTITELALGEKYDALDIAEQTDITAANMRLITAVDLVLSGRTTYYKVSQIDQPINSSNVWRLRLTPTGETA